jgi:hypothetical protein
MPTTPLSLALVELWIADPALPWSNPVWQSLTHIPGVPWAYDRGRGVTLVAEWTVDKAQAVEAFMNNCRTAQDPAEHFAAKGKDNDHEGRSAWNAWVKTSWVKWNINKLMDCIFEESGCEPHVVMARLKCKISDDVSYMLIRLSHNMINSWCSVSEDGSCSGETCRFHQIGRCIIR